MVITLKFKSTGKSSKFDGVSFDEEKMNDIIEKIDGDKIDLKVTTKTKDRYARIFTVNKDNCELMNEEDKNNDSDKFFINLFTDMNNSTSQWVNTNDPNDCISTDEAFLSKINDIDNADIMDLPVPLHDMVRYESAIFKDGNSKPKNGKDSPYDEKPRS